VPIIARQQDSRCRACHAVGHANRLPGDHDEALRHRLEREWAAAGEDDPYGFEELEELYRATGDAAQADRYGERSRAARQRERQ